MLPEGFQEEEFVKKGDLLTTRPLASAWRYEFLACGVELLLLMMATIMVMVVCGSGW
jgi:hypothetical protein